MALSASRSDLVSSGSIVVSAPPGRDARSGAHGLGPPKLCLRSLVQADLLPRTAGVVKADTASRRRRPAVMTFVIDSRAGNDHVCRLSEGRLSTVGTAWARTAAATAP